MTLYSKALGAAIAQATYDTRVLRRSGAPHAETVFRQLTEQGADFLLTV